MWMIVRKRQKSIGGNESTLALKPTGRVISSLKQRIPVAPQNLRTSAQQKLPPAYRNNQTNVCNGPINLYHAGYDEVFKLKGNQ